MKRILSAIAVISLLLLPGCDKENDGTRIPKVETISAEKDSSFVVTLSGRISGMGNIVDGIEYGIEYSTDSSFVQGKTIRCKIDKNYSEEPFIVTITKLTSGQTYYYRAFCIIQTFVYYGDVKEFTYTWQVPKVDSEVTYQYVDMGLTVKWATFNVGATKPEEYGDYYAWGEIEPKTDYDWTNYKWSKGEQNTLTKYCDSDSYGFEGFTDTLAVLTPEDDVAHVMWGGNWRMPTADDLEELWKHCEWEWYDEDNSEFNGVAGYKVTSFKEGYTDRFIFLPAAGYRYASSLYDDGIYGGYWTSSLYTGLPYYSNSLFSMESWLEVCNYTRQNGMSVRPVCP